MLTYLDPDSNQSSNPPCGLPLPPPMGEHEHEEVELPDELYLDVDLLLSGGREHMRQHGLLGC